MPKASERERTGSKPSKRPNNGHKDPNRTGLDDKKKRLKGAGGDEERFEVVQDDDTLLWLRAKRPIKSSFEVARFLESFLTFVSKETFFRTVWHKRALAITGLGSAHVASVLEKYFCNGDPGSLIRETASEEGVSVWLPNEGATAINSFKVQDADLVENMFSTVGASIYMRAPPSTCEHLTISAFRDLAIPFGVWSSDCKSRGEVEVFLASRPSKRTPTHTDFQENFTLQLLGRKRWGVHSGDVSNPLRAKAPHFANASMSIVETQLCASQICNGTSEIDPPPESSPGWRKVILEAGDVLYHPPGIWHNVETLEFDGVCLNVNISLVAPTWADLVSSSVRHMMWSASEVFRRPASLQEQTEASERIKEFLNSFAQTFDPRWNLPPLSMEVINRAAVISDEAKDEDDEEEESMDITESAVFDFREEHLDALESIRTNVKKNPLATLLMEVEFPGAASEDDESQEEDSSDYENTISIIVSINCGDDDIESKARFELQGLPRSLAPSMKKLREINSEMSLNTVRRMFQDLSEEGASNVVALLVKSGFLVEA